MAVFDFSRWRPSAILDFQKLEILTLSLLIWSRLLKLPWTKSSSEVYKTPGVISFAEMPKEAAAQKCSPQMKLLAR